MPASPQSTKLQAALSAEPAEARPGPLDAFKLARRTWQAGERIDMSALARELGVNRVTLYRWVGSREQLLVEIIWSQATRTLEKIEAEVDAGGGERVVEIVTRFVDAVNTNPGMQAWLGQEGESAMRLLTRYEPGFQPRLVAWIERLLSEEVEAGRLEIPAELGEVAFAIEQLVESHIYLDLITGETPEAGRIAAILRMLLR